MADDILDQTAAIRSLYQSVQEEARKVLSKATAEDSADIYRQKARRMAEDVRHSVIDNGQIPQPPPGANTRMALMITGALAPPLALLGTAAYAAGRQAMQSTAVRDAVEGTVRGLAETKKRKVAITVGTAVAAGATAATGGAAALAVPLVLAAPIVTQKTIALYRAARLFERQQLSRVDESLSRDEQRKRALKRIQTRRYEIHRKKLGPTHDSLRTMLRKDKDFQRHRPAAGSGGSADCGTWIDALGSYYQAVDAAEKTHSGMSEIFEFYFDLMTDADGCTKEFEDKLPACMDNIAAQVHGGPERHEERCQLSGLFSSLSTTRKKSHGFCYQWGRSSNTGWGPRAPKHSRAEGAWASNLKSENGRPWLMLKLFDDAASWGGLLSGYDTGTTVRKRMSRAVSIQPAGHDQSSQIKKAWLPGFFESDGRYRFVQSAAGAAETLRNHTALGRGGAVRDTPEKRAATEAGMKAASQAASKGISAAAASKAFVTVLQSAPAIAGFAGATVDLVSDYFNRRLNRGSFGSGRQLTWKERLKAFIPGTEVTATGELLAPEQFLDLEREALDDSFEALGEAWKMFRKAHGEFMDRASGPYSNCVEAFEAAAAILRHRILFYKLIEQAGVLHEYVHTVGLAYLSVAQGLVGAEPELVKDISGHLSAHVRRDGDTERTTLCAGFCYAPLSPSVVSEIDEIAWGRGAAGSPARPIGGNYQPVSVGS